MNYTLKYAKVSWDTKSTSHKGKKDKLDLIKIKNVCSFKKKLRK